MNTMIPDRYKKNIFTKMIDSSYCADTIKDIGMKWNVILNNMIPYVYKMNVFD